MLHPGTNFGAAQKLTFSTFLLSLSMLTDVEKTLVKESSMGFLSRQESKTANTISKEYDNENEVICYRSAEKSHTSLAH